MMLLCASGRTTPNYKVLADALQVDVLPKEKWKSQLFKGYGKGAFARDISTYFFDQCISHVLIADEQRTDLSWELLWSLTQQRPTMVGVTNNPEAWTDGGHWLVVERVSDRYLHFLDPAKRETDPSHHDKMSWSRFSNEWDGYAIAITDDATG